jgi:hypothetical protein
MRNLSGFGHLLIRSRTVIAFLLEIVPLEIERRAVNDLVKERPFQLVIVLCAAYAGAVLIQGATKLGLNIYRGWVGENATRDLRRHVIRYSRTAPPIAPGAEDRGIGAAMIVAEVEPTEVSSAAVFRAAASGRHLALRPCLYRAPRSMDGGGCARALFAAAGFRAVHARGDKPPRRSPGWKAEIGVDDGRELPNIPRVTWTIDRIS